MDDIEIYLIIIAFLGGCKYIERGLSKLGENIKEGLIYLGLGKNIDKKENRMDFNDKDS